MEAHSIIRRPVVSEKSDRLMNSTVSKGNPKRMNQYTFEVDKRATKSQIKHAIETLFDVVVVRVNTMNVRGKRKRRGTGPEGFTRSWKKAIVTLDQDSTIQMY